MSIPAELEQLRADQKRIAKEYRDPLRTDWYHTEGALLGVGDLLLEECLILIELPPEERL